MSTGENEQSLRAIIDFLRKGSIILLVIHFYVFCYSAFQLWGLAPEIVRRILVSLGETGLFNNLHISKLFALVLLLLSLLGSKGKKEEKIKPGAIIAYLLTGSLLYFSGIIFFYLEAGIQQIAVGYMCVTSIGFILILTGGARLSRLIRLKLKKDIFNELNETFPQEERLLQNEFSINLPGKYNLKGKIRRMWINIINPFRAVLIIGSPGAGKSYFIVRHIITQHIEKGFSMFLYDFKFDDLTRIAFNALLKNQQAYHKTPAFYVINFDDLTHSHRCNPLEPESMTDITDAAEAARSILLGLNRDWIKKSGGDRAIFN